MPKKGAAAAVAARITPPVKKQKKSNDTDIVLLAKDGQGYTRTALKNMEEAQFLAVTTRQDNCRFYVPPVYKEQEYGENQLTVCAKLSTASFLLP
jgi:hypothetical protein